MRLTHIALVLAFLHPAISRAQGTLAWYSGDCHPLVSGGFANWYTSNQQYTRVYDAFTVPAGGWTVSGVFSVNLLQNNPPPITQAAWEIRRDATETSSGTIVASGVGPVVAS